MHTGKNRRLKQAKEEAQAEIEQYRLQREKEFKTKEAAVGYCILTTWDIGHTNIFGFNQWSGQQLVASH